MTFSPLLPSGLACDPAETGPADAELSRMTELALRRGARSVAIGRGRLSRRGCGGHGLRPPLGGRRRRGPHHRYLAGGSRVVAAAGHPVRRGGPGPVDHGRVAARVGADDSPAAVVDPLAARPYPRLRRPRHAARDWARRRSQPARPRGRHRRRRHLGDLQRQHPGRPARRGYPRSTARLRLMATPPQGRSGRLVVVREIPITRGRLEGCVQCLGVAGRDDPGRA